MPGKTPGRPTRTLQHGFLEAILDPAVRLLLAMTATIILLGAGVYSVVEGWSFVDSVYFATVTLATVGYGDFAPQTTFGRLFTVGFILIGIGLFVALASALADHMIRRAQMDRGMMELKEHRPAPPPE